MIHRLFWQILCCVCLSGIPTLSAQVVINEFMTSNRSTTSDEDGDYEDWIELKNTAATAINLVGYGLSDDPFQPFKWTFPSWSLPAGGRLLVWASGKDRKGLVPQTGLLRELYLDIPGGSVETLEASGNFPEFPDQTSIHTSSFDLPRDIAERYGQRVSGFITPPVSGNYEFSISGDNGCRLFLSTGEDPSKARPIAEVPADRWSAPETYTTFPSQRSSFIALEAGKRYYLAALMKEEGGGDHLSVAWRRSGTGPSRSLIPASAFVVKPSALHTNFKIGADGEPLQLTRPDGTTADLVPAVALPADVSFGRQTPLSTAAVYFNPATPNQENASPGFSQIIEASPEFSQPGGFHESQFPLSLSTSEPGTSVIYTLDGSTPDPANLSGKTYQYKDNYPDGVLIAGAYATRAYTGPIQISDRSAQPNKISQRTTTFGTSSGYAPTSPVFKGTVVRARLVKPGALPGPVITHSYFVTPGAPNRYQLPVVSLSINEDDLFDYSRGLYTAGEDYDNWRTYSGFNGNGGTPANYKRRGPLAEHPANFELFTPGEGRVISQNLGFRIHGGWSRAWPQKSLRLYADRNDDRSSRTDRVTHPLIPGLTAMESGKPIDSFHRFVLRNSGNDHEQTRFRDAFIHELSKPLRLDQQGYQPTVHFINGEYWGLINIRERIDRFYISSHHGVPADRVAILSNNAEISEGSRSDRDDFIALRDYIARNDMRNPAHYAFVAQRMDLDNFIRYNVAQIYANNRDWPHNNIDTWRVNQPGGPSNIEGTSDGRWRWILFDTDFGFGLNGGADVNTLAHATRFAGTEDWSTVKLRSLLANTTFRNQFINTFADHMATSFLPTRVSSLADSMQEEISPYYTEHRKRWRNLGSTSTISIENFGNARPIHMRNHLMSRFGLSGSAEITLDTPDPAKGVIQINSIVIDTNTPGLTNPLQPYPWTGAYFEGVPIQITAQPAPGYRFAGWLEMPAETSRTITVNPQEDRQFTALFEEAPPQLLLHYWNFNDSQPLLAPTISQLAGGAMNIAPGPSSEIASGTGQEFDSINSRFNEEAGIHLRLNNPIGATMEWSLPTTGHSGGTLQYVTRRSSQGAGTQSVSYSIDGSRFIPLRSIPVTEEPTLHQFDFSDLTGAENNSSFKVRITFAQGGGGTAGNNRFDNISFEAQAIPGSNLPPIPLSGSDRLVLLEGGGSTRIDLRNWFEDAEGDPLSFSVTMSDSGFATAAITGPELILQGTRRGETILAITANDGNSASLPRHLILLVHPAAHTLSAGKFVFDQWNADAPEWTYPDHILFLQSEANDPSLTEPLARAYSVGTDHHEIDTAGFPYNNSQRTRINGLGDDGISFINTGRGRDLGGALLALDTRNTSQPLISFEAQTLVPGDRQYQVRLQYRVGTGGEFQDLVHEGQPVVYPSGQVIPDPVEFKDIELPAAAIDQPYVQLLWKYHHVSGAIGTRPEIRIDNILVSPAAPALAGYQQWRQQAFPDPGDQADPSISGPGADPYSWGIPNLIRYALDIETATDAAQRMPRLVHDGTRQLQFRFPWDLNKNDVAFIVESSADLQFWSEVIFDSRNPRDLQPEDGWLNLDIDDAPQTSAPERFFRLNVTSLTEK